MAKASTCCRNFCCWFVGMMSIGAMGGLGAILGLVGLWNIGYQLLVALVMAFDAELPDAGLAKWTQTKARSYSQNVLCKSVNGGKGCAAWGTDYSNN